MHTSAQVVHFQGSQKASRLQTIQTRQYCSANLQCLTHSILILELISAGKRVMAVTFRCFATHSDSVRLLDLLGRCTNILKSLRQSFQMGRKGTYLMKLQYNK